MEKELMTEERIKRSARNVFSRKGFAGARISEIANSAGVKNAMVHYYFRSKQSLFDTIMKETVMKLRSIINDQTNESKEKIYNATTGKKIDLITLANLVNETSDFKSEIKVLNDGLNNEYTSNNERIMKELKNFEFTSHKKAIQKMREYFKANLEKLDKESIINDPYLKEINNIWKGK